MTEVVNDKSASELKFKIANSRKSDHSKTPKDIITMGCENGVDVTKAQHNVILIRRLMEEANSRDTELMNLKYRYQKDIAELTENYRKCKGELLKITEEKELLLKLLKTRDARVTDEIIGNIELEVEKLDNLQNRKDPQYTVDNNINTPTNQRDTADTRKNLPDNDVKSWQIVR